MWHFKAITFPVVIEALGMISKGANTYVNEIPGSLKVCELQKVIIIGGSHILCRFSPYNGIHFFPLWMHRLSYVCIFCYIKSHGSWSRGVGRLVPQKENAKYIACNNFGSCACNYWVGGGVCNSVLNKGQIDCWSKKWPSVTGVRNSLLILTLPILTDALL